MKTLKASLIEVLLSFPILYRSFKEEWKIWAGGVKVGGCHNFIFCCLSVLDLLLPFSASYFLCASPLGTWASWNFSNSGAVIE